MTIHLLGLSLSPTAAVLLAALLGLVAGAGLGWLVRDYLAHDDGDDCHCDYARGAFWCDEHAAEALSWKQDPKPPVPKEARITYK